MHLNDYITKHGLDAVFEDSLVGNMKLKEVVRGEQLVRLGEKLEWFYLLVAGKLKVYRLVENGKKILIRFFRPLSAIGDLEFLSDFPPNAVVEAIDPSLVIAVPMKEIRKKAYDCPRFLRFVILQLSQKAYAFSKISSMNLVYPLENRIASYLWSVSKIDDDKDLEEIRVNSLTELADLLATSYRHLSRVLSSMESEGIISRIRGGIKIIDFQKLETLSVGLFE